MEKITVKGLLRIRFRLKTSLSIGSGKKEKTDHDILLDGEGKPYIPGTAIAGVLGDMIDSRILNVDIYKRDLQTYFGYVPDYRQAEKGEKAITSKICFYDANVKEPEEKNRKAFHISKRDFVKLNKWKTAEKGAKYDSETLESNVEFETFIEQNFYETANRDYLDLIASIWKTENLKFGAKTTKGFGRIRDVNIEKIMIPMDDKEAIQHWLEYSMYDDELWTDKEDLLQADEGQWDGKVEFKEKTLDLKLESVSGITVRRYTTEPSNSENELIASPDYEQFKTHDGTPVIPGTTWAGAFSSNMKGMVKDLNEEYFGTAESKKEKSGIEFSESQISESKSKLLSRNAIERFSGGTVKGALYTEKTEYGGTTDLQITFTKGNPGEDFLRAFAASVADLHAGIMSIGGLTAVGRGLFNVTEVDSERFSGSPEQLYVKVLKKMDDAFGLPEKTTTLSDENEVMEQ